MGSARDWQDITALRESSHAFVAESPDARELCCLENLEAVKVTMMLLEQQLADQSGNKYFQDKLVEAREWQKVWERNLGSVRNLRRLLLSTLCRCPASCHS